MPCSGPAGRIAIDQHRSAAGNSPAGKSMLRHRFGRIKVGRLARGRRHPAGILQSCGLFFFSGCRGIIPAGQKSTTTDSSCHKIDHPVWSAFRGRTGWAHGSAAFSCSRLGVQAKRRSENSEGRTPSKIIKAACIAMALQGILLHCGVPTCRPRGYRSCWRTSPHTTSSTTLPPSHNHT